MSPRKLILYIFPVQKLRLTSLFRKISFFSELSETNNELDIRCIPLRCIPLRCKPLRRTKKTGTCLLPIESFQYFIIFLRSTKSLFSTQYCEQYTESQYQTCSCIILYFCGSFHLKNRLPDNCAPIKQIIDRVPWENQGSHPIRNSIFYYLRFLLLTSVKESTASPQLTDTTPTNHLHDWHSHHSPFHIPSLTSHSSLAEEDWHMPIESSQYLIILFRVNQVFTFYHFIENTSLVV